MAGIKGVEYEVIRIMCKKKKKKKCRVTFCHITPSCPENKSAHSASGAFLGQLRHPDLTALSR